MTTGGAGLAIDHVLGSISDPNAGPSYSVTSLAVAQAVQGLKPHIHTVAGWRGYGEPPLLPGVAHTAYALSRMPVLRRMAHSQALQRSVFSRAQSPTILHAHGLWLLPNIYPGEAVTQLGARAKLICAPRGMLGADALRFSSLPKRAVWLLAQRRALARAHCIHATAESEYREIRAAGLVNPVAIIRNGIEMPEEISTVSATTRERVILSLGRIHPKKGLDRLIAAWSRVEGTHPNWRLRIVGPAEGDYHRQLIAMAQKKGLQNVTIEPALSGDRKQQAFHEAELFVLPSLNENFAMTVAEALAYGVPVIATRGAPWSGLDLHRCGWWIEHGIDVLAATLDSAMSMPRSELSRMGQRGRAWMERDFAWDAVAREMGDVYRWLVDGAECPQCVLTT